MNMCRTGNQNKGDSGVDIPCLNDRLVGVFGFFCREGNYIYNLGLNGPSCRMTSSFNLPRYFLDKNHNTTQEMRYSFEMFRYWESKAKFLASLN